MKQEGRDRNATARQAGGGYITGRYNRGDARGYNTTTGTGYGADRQAGYNDNVNYAGDAAGGYAYSTTGSQDYRSGQYETRNWEEREPNNAAGTRRNTRVAEDDPCYGSYH
ncbi:hypothetical protein CRYUN_Cryun16bG0085100 [Craigia yunnanensis]